MKSDLGDAKLRRTAGEAETADGGPVGAASSGTRRWNPTHAVSCLLVAVTAVLLSFGALVTTYEAAMAVPDWPSTYGHNLVLFPWGEWLYGPWDLFLEHGHRLLGALVGLITLALAGMVWWRGGTAAVRALVVAAVLLVVVQGLLGGARVLLDDRTIAKVHACTGPLFFAVAVAVATLTGRGGSRARVADAGWTGSALVVAAYLQLVAGAQLRHLDVTADPASFRGLVALHVTGAVVVLVLALAAARGAGEGSYRRDATWSRIVVGLVCVQWMLGLGTWIVNWGLPTGMVPEAWRPAEALQARSGWGAAVITGHVVLGMFILGATVAAAIRSGAIDRVVAMGRLRDPAAKRGFA